MITAVIAEKPSVAKDIANVLNVRERHDGYLSGNGYLVTWAFGHLVQLAMPEAYGYTGFPPARYGRARSTSPTSACSNS